MDENSQEEALEIMRKLLVGVKDNELDEWKLSYHKTFTSTASLIEFLNSKDMGLFQNSGKLQKTLDYFKKKLTNAINSTGGHKFKSIKKAQLVQALSQVNDAKSGLEETTYLGKLFNLVIIAVLLTLFSLLIIEYGCVRLPSSSLTNLLGESGTSFLNNVCKQVPSDVKDFRKTIPSYLAKYVFQKLDLSS